MITVLSYHWPIFKTECSRRKSKAACEKQTTEDEYIGFF